MQPVADDVALQRQYYARTAQNYDDMHVHNKDPHYFALHFMLSMLDFFEIRSVLDIGAGTGRTVKFIRDRRPDIRVVGIEPVQELIAEGHRKGLTADELKLGDATGLEFADGEFDLVCEFAVLHHIRRPEQAVSEMLRVAKKAIFISDSNRFGQARPLKRLTKQVLAALGLLHWVDLIKTKGKGYHVSEGDGLSYSYSVYTNYKQIRKQCRLVHIVNTADAGISAYCTAASIALLGVK